MRLKRGMTRIKALLSPGPEQAVPAPPRTVPIRIRKYSLYADVILFNQHFSQLRTECGLHSIKIDKGGCSDASIGCARVSSRTTIALEHFVRAISCLVVRFCCGFPM